MMSHLKLLQTQSCPILPHCLWSVPSKQNRNIASVGPFLSPKKLHMTRKFQVPMLGANFHCMCEWLNLFIFYSRNKLFSWNPFKWWIFKNASFLKLKTWFLHLETHFLCLDTRFIQVFSLQSRLSTYFWAVLKYSSVRNTIYKVPSRSINY